MHVFASVCACPWVCQWILGAQRKILVIPASLPVLGVMLLGFVSVPPWHSVEDDGRFRTSASAWQHAGPVGVSGSDSVLPWWNARHERQEQCAECLFVRACVRVCVHVCVCLLLAHNAVVAGCWRGCSLTVCRNIISNMSAVRRV